MIAKKLQQLIIRYSHHRFKENIVVIESDDWGLLRNGNNIDVKKYGIPKHWSTELREKPHEVLELSNTLAQFKDRFERPACFTANFITREPDFEKISEHNFNAYYDKIISDKALLHEYSKSISSKTFFPQYHGRSHLNTQSWLIALQKNNLEKELFAKQYFPGMQLFKGNGDLHKSEYYLVEKSLLSENMEQWIQTGLKDFIELFGFSSDSTIAPHYIFNDEIEWLWKLNGIKYIQGGNYHILKKQNNKELLQKHYIGQKNKYHQLYLGRNVNFEPSENNPNRNHKTALNIINYLAKNKFPIVIDTHRINYTGKNFSTGISDLNALLQKLKELSPLYLTSTELGEAMLNNGQFTDAFTGKKRKITPVSSFLNKASRLIFKLVSK